MSRFARNKPKRVRERCGEAFTAESYLRLAAKGAEEVPQFGEIIDLTIESVAPGGKALTHDAEGRVVFVDLGLPGQKVRAEIIRRKSGYLEARRLEVLSPAPEQQTPFCAYFGECGGCIWQEMPYARQLEFKRAHIRESLSRLGQVQEAAGPQGRVPLEAVIAPILPSPVERHFRGKIELVFGEDASRRKGSTKSPLAVDAPPLLGFRHLGSHEVVDVAACPIADIRLPELLVEVKAWAAKSGLRAYAAPASAPGSERDISAILRFLVLRVSSLTGSAAVELITAPGPQAAKRIRELGESLLARLPWLASFTHSVRRAEEPVAYGEEVTLHLGAPYLSEGLAGFKYELSPASFFQVNPAAAEVLLAESMRLLAPKPGEVIWDLYAGAGAFSLPLAASGAKVTGLEANPTAVADARRNATGNNLENCIFLEGDVRVLLRKQLLSGAARPDAVLADPPRAGLHADVAAGLLRLKPGRILLVSCHMATLARDLGVLSKGYDLRAVQGVDLFPHSAHVEVLCLLSARV